MQETVGYAIMTEVPCVIIDVQRGGPSTGLPTKTEQSDLNLAIWRLFKQAGITIPFPQRDVHFNAHTPLTVGRDADTDGQKREGE